jgi:twitching motility protein PilT
MDGSFRFRFDRIIMKIDDLIHQAGILQASDIHLINMCTPLIRVDGTIRPLGDMPKLTDVELNSFVDELTTSEQRAIFQKTMELDFSYAAPDGWLIRGNICYQKHSKSIALRLISPAIPTIDELGLPQMCKDLVAKPRGLIVVTGPVGSGKTTTLAAMINYLNHNDHKYVITIEDPIEYVHPNIKSAVSQRELSEDTLSYAKALRHVLRQDPDVILVGEIRDMDTAAAVLEVAEVGHLILTTAHAPSATGAIERIVDLFPPYERPMTQARVALVLNAILCQALVPRINGGRIAAVEIMLANPAIKSLIREGKTHQIPNVIRTQSQMGMITMDESLVNLYTDGVIDWDTVIGKCYDIEETEKIWNSSSSARKTKSKTSEGIK